MKKLVAMTLCVLTIITTLPCNAQDIKSNPVSSNNAPKVSYTHNYESLMDLLENSELCIIGTVKNSTPSSLSTNHILENVQILSNKTKQLTPNFTVSTFGNVASQPDEVKLLNKGDTYLFFLHKTWPDDDSSSLYSEVGAYQGIFEVFPSKSGKLSDFTIKKFNDKNTIENKIVGKSLGELMGNLFSMEIDNQINDSRVKDYPIRVLDENNTPISNMYINGITPNTVSANDFSNLIESGFTDEEGCLTLKLTADCPIYVDSKPTSHSGQEYHTASLSKKNGKFTITWTDDTPLERVNKSENGFRFRVLDTKGNPVSGLHITGKRILDLQVLDDDAPVVLDGYTDKNGYFCSLTLINGESFGDRLQINVSQENKNRTVTYNVSTSATKKNWYKITWK